MISGEDFQKVEQELASGASTISSEIVSSLVETIKVLDLHLAIAQNSIELSLANTGNVVPDIAHKVMSICGRTDQKTKKKVAELAAQVVAQCEDSVQTYLAKALLEAMQLPEVQPESQDDPYAGRAPHNHD